MKGGDPLKIQTICLNHNKENLPHLREKGSLNTEINKFAKKLNSFKLVNNVQTFNKAVLQPHSGGRLPTARPVNIDPRIHKALEHAAIKDDLSTENIQRGIALGTVSNFKLDISEADNAAIALNAHRAVDTCVTGALADNLKRIRRSTSKDQAEEVVCCVVAIFNVQSSAIFADLKTGLKNDFFFLSNIACFLF